MQLDKAKKKRMSLGMAAPSPKQESVPMAKPVSDLKAPLGEIAVNSSPPPVVNEVKEAKKEALSLSRSLSWDEGKKVKQQQVLKEQ